MRLVRVMHLSTMDYGISRHGLCCKQYIYLPTSTIFIILICTQFFSTSPVWLWSVPSVTLVRSLSVALATRHNYKPLPMSQQKRKSAWANCSSMSWAGRWIFAKDAPEGEGWVGCGGWEIMCEGSSAGCRLSSPYWPPRVKTCVWTWQDDYRPPPVNGHQCFTAGGSVLLLHTTISPGQLGVACGDLQLDLAAPSLASTGLFCLQANLLP